MTVGTELDPPSLSALLGHSWRSRWVPEYYRWYPKRLLAAPAEPFAVGPVEGIYVHVPFCDVLCPFCPFNRGLRGSIDLDEFVGRILAEADLYRERGASGPISFLYLGGGTPSVLEAGTLARLVNGLASRFDLTGDCEISMEVHPFHATMARVGEYRAVGATRFSVGVQSFSDRRLRAVGSFHSAAESRSAAETVARLGRGAVDVLYRCRADEPGDAVDDVRAAATYGVGHLSVYPLALASDEGLPEVHEALAAALAVEEAVGKLGFSHYASCASGGFDYALPGQTCRYEHRHWAAPQAEYLGLGPGAFGYVAGRTTVNTHRYSDYASAVGGGELPLAHVGVPSTAEAMRRFMAIGVKCLTLPLADFRARFHIDVADAFPDEIAMLGKLDLALVEGGAFKLTSVGRYFVDQVSEIFWSPEEREVPHPETGALRVAESQQAAARSAAQEGA